MILDDTFWLSCFGSWLIVSRDGTVISMSCFGTGKYLVLHLHVATLVEVTIVGGDSIESAVQS